MDITETYIKMCEKAYNFLPIIEPQIGQWWVIAPYKGREVELVCEGESWQEPYLRPWADYVSSEVEDFSYVSMIAKSFPIYSQDQLQEMIGDYKYCLFLIDRWEQGSAVDCDYPDVTSMEQLWLAFCMFNNYNRRWDGEKWVECGELKQG